MLNSKAELTSLNYFNLIHLQLLGFWGFGVLGLWGFGALGFWGFGAARRSTGRARRPGTPTGLSPMLVRHFAIIIELIIIAKWQSSIGESPVGWPGRISH